MELLLGLIAVSANLDLSAVSSREHFSENFFLAQAILFNFKGKCFLPDQNGLLKLINEQILGNDRYNDSLVERIIRLMNAYSKLHLLKSCWMVHVYFLCVSNLVYVDVITFWVLHTVDTSVKLERLMLFVWHKVIVRLGFTLLAIKIVYVITCLIYNHVLGIYHHFHGDAYVDQSFTILKILVVSFKLRVYFRNGFDMHLALWEIRILERVHLQIMPLVSAKFESCQSLIV